MATQITAGNATTGAAISSDNTGAMTLTVGPSGSPVNALSIDTSGNVTPQALVGGKQLYLGTPQASTSGTNIDFTGIPAWAKRITVMFNGVSTNGTSLVQIQIGSGSFQNTGYSGTYTQLQSTANALAALSSGFVLEAAANAAAFRHGIVFLTLMDSATGLWAASGQSGRSDTASFTVMAGTKTLSGTLDRIRITTVNGTDLFDAGSINIMWE